MLAISFAWGGASWAFCCFQAIRTPSYNVFYSVLGFLPLSHPDGMLCLQNLLCMLLTFTHLPQWHQWLITGSIRVGHNWGISLSLFTFMYWTRKWQPTPVLLPGESQGWGSLVGCSLWGHTELDMTEVDFRGIEPSTFKMGTLSLGDDSGSLARREVLL